MVLKELLNTWLNDKPKIIDLEPCDYYDIYILMR